jgi:predicted adenylyl cyclase CyaB
MAHAWLFADPEETEVITLQRILRRESSVLLVTHDREDGAWQFLDGDHVFENDAAVVYLGEMVQFDPSLSELADLSQGWYAWRATPNHPWQRAEGEAPSAPVRHSTDGARDHIRATNIEIKARVSDFDQLRATVESASDSAVEVLNQEDVFFAVPEGRLKLRILDEHCGELIHYHRGDAAEPKASSYLIAPTTTPKAMRVILSQVLPIVGVVRKRRWLYRVGQTRIHLDRVEGLGEFVELEVVLRPDQEQAQGIAIAQHLMSLLGIVPGQLIRTSYIDMMKHSE